MCLQVVSKWIIFVITDATILYGTMVKLTYNGICDYKMVLSYICSYNFQLLSI